MTRRFTALFAVEMAFFIEMTEPFWADFAHPLFAPDMSGDPMAYREGTVCGESEGPVYLWRGWQGEVEIDL